MSCVLVSALLLVGPVAMGQVAPDPPPSAAHEADAASPADVAAPAAVASPTDVASPADVARYADVVGVIVREALQRGRAHERLVELCTLAPRRLAGSPGGRAAEEWAAGVLRADGFDDVRLEPATATHWERGTGELVFVRPERLAGESLALLALGGSVGTPPEGVEGQLVVVRGLREGERLGERAAGRIVLFDGPLDAGLWSTFEAYGGAVRQRGAGASVAARQGAVAALVRSMTTRRDDFPHTGALRYADDAPRIPAAAVSTLAAERLAALVRAGEEVVLRLTQDCRTVGQAVVHNVVGEWPGRERPDEIVLVGGHLDAWDVGQGAHDDGAGCCHALEAVRLLRALGLHPRRTLRVVLFANEENGLAGARAYEAAHRDELARHVLALESDAGGFTPRGFDTNANPAAREILAAIAALLEPYGAGDLAVSEGGGADLGPLKPHGVPLVGFRPDPQRYFDVHHSDRDTLDQVSDRELNLGAGVIAALLYVVADLPETLPRNEPQADD